MAGNVVAFVVCLLVVVSATLNDEEFDEASLATRTLLSAAVFDGRVVMPVAGGRLLFRVRRVYKGWHGDVDRDRRVTKLKSSDARRLIYISCGSTNFRQSMIDRSDGCHLSSAVVGRRYFVFAESFHAVVVNVAVRERRPPTSTTVAVYRTSGSLVPVTGRSRRIAVLYSNLSFG